MWCFCMFVHSDSYHRDILWWCSALLDKGDELEATNLGKWIQSQIYHCQPLMVTPCRCLKDHQGFMEWALRSSCFKGGKHWRGRDGLGGVKPRSTGLVWFFLESLRRFVDTKASRFVLIQVLQPVCTQVAMAWCWEWEEIGSGMFRRQSFKVAKSVFECFCPY